eukprot:1162143-Pelagomonas_calceolata.AAC.7
MNPGKLSAASSTATFQARSHPDTCSVMCPCLMLPIFSNPFAARLQVHATMPKQRSCHSDSHRRKAATHSESKEVAI